MFRAQTIADVRHTTAEVGVLTDEILVHLVVLDDVVGDEVEDRQIRMRVEDDRHVSQVKAALFKGGQYCHFDVGGAEAAVGHPGPQDRVHLRHVGAPEHEGVGGFDVVVAAHGFINTEGAHEATHRGRHAVTGVGVDVVGAETGFHQFDRSVAFPHRPLAGAEHADAFRTFIFQRGFVFFFHDIEGLFPAHRGELAFFIKLAVFHAQQGLGESIRAVHDFGQEVALHAVQAAVDLAGDVAVGGHHFAILGGHVYAAAGTAEAAWGLVPVKVGLAAVCHQVGGLGSGADTGGSRSGGGCLHFQEGTTVGSHG